MSRVHGEYETLCAFAAAGQLSEAELNDLGEHVDSCSCCQRRVTEMEAASYAYFVRHADKSKAVGTPPGMQRRFEERIGSMGLPLREIAAPLPGSRLVSVALSLVLLTVAAQVGWKALDLRMRERNAGDVKTAFVRPPQTISQVPGSAAGAPAVHRGQAGGLSAIRKMRHVRDVHLDTAAHREVRKAPSYSPPGAVRDSLTEVVSAPARRAFALTASSGFLAGGESSIATKHTFRYSPKLASLSFFGVPERVEVPRLPAMNEPPPLFNRQSPKAW